MPHYGGSGEGAASTVGCVFNVQRFSIHDGPGVRTTVFLKGCGMRCLWCHNPESLDPRPQPLYSHVKCIGCGKCMAACAPKAFSLAPGGWSHEMGRCLRCGECAKACDAEAISMSGRYASVGEVMAEVMRDGFYYANSGGGVTFSGGEPLLQPEFLSGLLTEGKALGLHTAVETAGNVPWGAIEAMIPVTDLWIYDLKAWDDGLHARATGVGNGLVKANLGRLAAAGSDLWVRMPVVPGFNDSIVEAESMARYLRTLKGVGRVELLALNHAAEGKYVGLGLPYPVGGVIPPTSDSMSRLRAVYSGMGLPVAGA